VRLSANEDGDVFVRHFHPAEVERLEEVKGGRELPDPRRRRAAPVVGYEVEHGGAGLGLELERLEAREPAEEPLRRGRIGHGHRDVLPAERVHAAPVAAHERDGVAVPGVLHVTQHQPQRGVRDLEAQRPHQLPLPVPAAALVVHRASRTEPPADLSRLDLLRLAADLFAQGLELDGGGVENEILWRAFCRLPSGGVGRVEWTRKGKRERGGEFTGCVSGDEGTVNHFSLEFTGSGHCAMDCVRLGLLICGPNFTRQRVTYIRGSR
jgi:hypothetical protein